MAGETQSTYNPAGEGWPLPKFHFSVDIGTGDMAFKEVSGLEGEVTPIEYRHSNSPNFTKIKMPGLKVFTNVVLRKGVFVGDNELFDWFNEIQMNTIERRTVVIKLLDETGSPTMTWTLNNAFPVKITATPLDSEDDGEPAIEELELAHEGILQENP